VEKIDQPVQGLDYTENYRRIYRKLLREAKTRENDRYIIG